MMTKLSANATLKILKESWTNIIWTKRIEVREYDLSEKNPCVNTMEFSSFDDVMKEYGEDQEVLNFCTLSEGKKNEVLILNIVL